MAANGISTLDTKEERQIAKLNIAATKRGQSYSRDLLPTKYVGDAVVYNSHPNGLVPHRPWLNTPPATYNIVFKNMLGDVITSANEGTIVVYSIDGTNMTTGTATVQFSGAGITNADATIGAGNLLDAVSFPITGDIAPGSYYGLATINADNLTEGNETLTLTWTINSTVVATKSLTINDTSQDPTLVINLDASNAGLGITANANETGHDANGYYLMINGNYAPYLPILSADTTWVVSGGPNNLHNEPVIYVVPTNFHGYGANVGAIYIAVDPGNNSSPFTFAPAQPVWNDLSTNNYDSALHGGATLSASNGGRMLLNGTDGYVSIPQNYVDWLHQDFTISVWFKTTDTGVILGQQDTNTPNTASGFVPAIYIGTDNKLYVSCFWHGSSSLAPISYLAPNDGRWHMVTISASATGNTNIFFDDSVGVSNIGFPAQQSYGSGDTYYYYLGTGKRGNWSNAVGTSTYMNLKIGSFKTWYGALPKSWHTSEYNNTKARFLYPGPFELNWYGVVTNPIPTNNYTTDIGGVTLGSNSYIDVGAGLSGTVFTIIIDANLGVGWNNNTWDVVWANEAYTGTNAGMFCAVIDSTHMTMGTPNHEINVVIPDITQNKRTLYAWVVNGTSIKLYVNGALAGSGTTTAFASPGNNFIIGARHQADGSFASPVDSQGGTYNSVNVQNTAYTATDVLNTYNNWLDSI